MSFKFKVTTTPAHLEIPDSAKAAANARALAMNLSQIAAKLDANGRPLPRGVTLRDTGALVGSGQSSPAGYRFGVPYAGYVDQRYHFIGIAPANRPRLEAEISAIWDSQPLEIIED